jgi:inhibitor of KinA sporulation pathway (predicted exonuclease)
VKRLVALIAGWTRETGMMKALKRLGLEATPGSTHHRGTDDAVEIARMLGMAMGVRARCRGNGERRKPA